MAPQLHSRAIYFGPFLVTSQVFYVTAYSFAVVNLKPLVKGHVLVCPQRRVPRLRDLTAPEMADLFTTVQRVSSMLERRSSSDSNKGQSQTRTDPGPTVGEMAFNVAVQDGVAAGQSVPHVHAHILPRTNGDLDDSGGTDAIYDMLQGRHGDLGAALVQREMARARSKLQAPAEDDRKPRTEDEMRLEAEWFADEMGRLDD